MIRKDRECQKVSKESYQTITYRQDRNSFFKVRVVNSNFADCQD